MQLVTKYRDNWVLTIGGMNEVRERARKLGFNKVLIPSDLTKELAKVCPPQITASIHNAVALPRPPAEQYEPIYAVLVFAKPQDWDLDLQILLTLSLSGNGTLGSGTSAGSDIQNLGYRFTPKIYCLSLESKHLMAQNATTERAFLCALQYMWEEGR